MRCFSLRWPHVDIIPWSIADAPGPKKKPRQNAQKDNGSGPTMLDQFVGRKPALESKDDDDEDEDEDEDDGDVMMMEDGTMTAT